MDKISVLITGVGGRSVGYQILACLKKFPTRYRIVATDSDAFSAGLYQANKAYLLPQASEKNYIQKLIEVSLKENIKAILPGSQPEVIKISENENLLKKNGIIPIVNSKELVRIVANKATQYKLLQSHGFIVPNFINIRGNLPKKIPLSFPLIVKPSVAHAGSRNVFIIKSFEELQEVFQQTKKDRVEILLQEYVGNSDNEYTVGVIADKDKNVIDAIVMKRKLQGLSLAAERVINGKTYKISSGLSQGVFIQNEEVKKYCMKVAKTIGAKGPLNVQLRLTENGFSIFEIHTRFSGSASQRAVVGFNEPDLLIRNFVFGEKIDIQNPMKNIVVIRYVENVIVPEKQLQKIRKEGELDIY